MGGGKKMRTNFCKISQKFCEISQKSKITLRDLAKVKNNFLFFSHVSLGPSYNADMAQFLCNILSKGASKGIANFENAEVEALAAGLFRSHSCEKQIGDETFLSLCHMPFFFA